MRRTFVRAWKFLKKRAKKQNFKKMQTEQPSFLKTCPVYPNYEDFQNVLPFYHYVLDGDCLHAEEGKKFWLNKNVHTRIFCNLFPAPIEVEGQKFPSVEHYFQVIKYQEKEFMMQLSVGNHSNHDSIQMRLLLLVKGDLSWKKSISISSKS